MILITDIGKDPDDAFALTYAVIMGLPISDVIITTKESAASAHICWNILNNLSDRYPTAKNIKIHAGSIKPVKGDSSFRDNYYHGIFSELGPVPNKFEALKIQLGDCVIIGPLTDFLELLKNNRARRAVFMAQCRKDHNEILPDMESYNLRCDPFATEAAFQFQDRIPYAFIGKNLAYQVPFTTQDIDALEALSHPVARFLADHAYQSFEAFKARMPDLFEKKYKNTNNMSYCYDPLTILAITNPDLFIFEKFGRHRIGVSINAARAKETLFSALMNGLN